MLIEFKARNYKSFKDEFVFSMNPAPKQKGLEYSILSEKIGRHKYRALCSSVIYGPNASGKTNIISAMDTFKNIVLRGNIRNEDDKNEPNTASYILELIPNNTTAEDLPVFFSIKFITNGLLIEYSFEAMIGSFLQTEYPRKIIAETLNVNNEMVFKRTQGLKFGTLKVISQYLVNRFEQNKNSAFALAASNLYDDELFLMNGFKTMFSTKLVNLISDWLDNRFMVIYRADAFHLIRKFADPNKRSIYIEKTLNEAAAYFGINSNALGYAATGDDNETKLLSVFRTGNKNTIKAIPAEIFESYGTIRFVNMFPLVVSALINGGTLVVDEFDASIHPMALMSIINIFHNDMINVNNAQLIFNTHNPIFLNRNLFRRDEIKFVERDDDNHCSILYSLSDFGTSGKTGVRKNEDYMKNYFISRYGAIKDIDFTPIFEDILNNSKEV